MPQHKKWAVSAFRKNAAEGGEYMNDSQQTAEERNLAEMSALMNGHAITGEDGSEEEGGEEPSFENTDAQEMKTSENETSTAEKPAESETTPSQEADSEDADLGVDDSGKRYVPEKRFKDVYGKAKQAERELAALKAQLEQGNRLLESTKAPGKTLPEPERVIDKADILELKLTKPAFNPQSTEYSRELDELAFKIYKAEDGISIMEAAEKAEEYARALSSRIAQGRSEARLVKSIQSDQGLARANAQRGPQAPDVDAMSDEEMERYLRETNSW